MTAKFRPLRPPFQDRDPSVWHPDLVGVIPRYPKTPLDFARRHRLAPPQELAAPLQDPKVPHRDRLVWAASVLEAVRRQPP